MLFPHRQEEIHERWEPSHGRIPTTGFSDVEFAWWAWPFVIGGPRVPQTHADPSQAATTWATQRPAAGDPEGAVRPGEQRPPAPGPRRRAVEASRCPRDRCTRRRRSTRR